MANFEAAIMYVERHGSEMEKARLDQMLTGLPGPETANRSLQSNQRQDGSWSPFWAQDASSLDATCFHLAKAEQLGLSEQHPLVNRAVGFLAARQNGDGSWEEDNRLAEFAPPWAKPGDLAAKLYITANCGYWLSYFTKGKSGGQAAEYLQKYLDEDGSMPSYLNTHWLTCSILFERGKCVQAGLIAQYLSSRLRELAPSDLAWMINALIAVGFPPHDGLLEKAADLLSQKQCETGRWAGEDSPTQDVHTTLESIRALLKCGRFDEHLFFA